MWILNIGLTIITVRGILLLFIQNECGYLEFFPLSGVSQAHLGNRISLRFLHVLMAKKRRETYICFSIFFS